jgi:hypothetical protein
MNWTESAGGPLIVISESLLPHWTGAAGPDYQKACAVEDEVGVLPYRDGTVVVLGDEPHATAWLERPDGGVLARWVYAPSEQAVQQLLMRRGSVQLEDTGIRVEVNDTYRLMDSAEAGLAGRHSWPVIRLSRGIYRIESGLQEDGEDVQVLLHRLVAT